MRFILLTETLLVGGAETFVVRIANALAERGHEVAVAVTHGDLIHPALVGQLDSCVTMEKLTLPAKRWLWRADRALRLLRIDLQILHRIQKKWLKAVVERLSPDIIHSHLLKADRLASDLRIADDRLRHVVTIHGDYALFFSGQADPQLLDLPRRAAAIVTHSDAVVTISQEQMDYFRARYPLAAPKVHLLYNGYAPPARDGPWPSRPELGLPDGKVLFGMVARGIEEKGWAEAIAAFEALGRDDAALVLVGDGPYLDKLRGADLPPGVILVGFSANPLDYIRHFDVALLPSRYGAESLPTVIIEYLFCAKPVIATDIGEIGAMIRTAEGETAGMLLDFSNGTVKVDELAGAMERLMDDPALRERQSDLARQAFAKFDMDECVGKYLALYESVVARRGSSSSPINFNH